MPAYRVLDAHIYHDGAMYGPGDMVELTEEQAEKLRVAKVAEGRKNQEKGGTRKR